MLKDFMREVVATVTGKQVEAIADLLLNKKHVNEFIIAKKMDITINQARNILYKLADFGLVSSIRKKDRKKGWFTYFWRIEILKSLEFLKSLYLKKIEQINNQLKNRETKQFYICERCNIEFNEENALLYNFTCNECGGIFSLKDNSKILKEFKKNKDKFESEIKSIDVEIEKESAKFEKERQKEIKKEEKERAKKKAADKKAKSKLKSNSKSKPKKSIKKKETSKKKIKKRKK
jgi:transcription factor E